MKLKLILNYKKDGSHIAEMLGFSESIITDIASFINSELNNKITPVQLINICIEKYKDADLLIAFMLIWNICMVDAQARMILDHIEFARMGTVMPREIQ